jgi:uncharacterized protein (TIGR03437 family)
MIFIPRALRRLMWVHGATLLLLVATRSSVWGATSQSSIVLANAPSSSTYGGAVTLTATVLPAGASGRVTFYIGVAPLATVPLSNGLAKYTTAFLPVGKLSLHAYYSGDSTHTSVASAAVIQNVQPIPGGGFQAPQNSGVGYLPWSLAAADFNEDGILDLAIACEDATTIGIAIGNGDGTFRPVVIYGGVNTPRWIATGDFNGDGHTDLAVANLEGDNVIIFLGNGDGSFQSPLSVPIGTATHPYALVTGDFNRDGIMDLAVANNAQSTVTILLGNGDGTFQSPISNEAGADQRSIVAGDFNGDGIADLVTGNYGGSTITVLLGKGDGTFAGPVMYPAAIGASTTSNPRSIAVADYNGDGIPDLAVANQSGSLVIFTGKGDGTFQSGVSACPTCATDFLDSPYSVAAGDLNGDGKVDLVTANFGSDNVSLLLGNGDGTFVVTASFSADTNPAWVTMGNFRRNGMVDVVTANNGANTISFLASIRPSPDLTVALEPPPIGSLVQGQSGGVYQIDVNNVGFAPSAGAVTAAVTLPPGVSAMQINGSNWNCSLATLSCTRSDALNAFSSYPPISLTLNIASSAPAGITIMAVVSGGGDKDPSNNTARDYTTTFSPSAVASAWSALNLSTPTLPSNFANSADAPLLLTDGSIMVHQFCSGNWYRLIPGPSGGYGDGTWKQTASMPSNYSPLYFASAVLPDDRLVVIGGEYNGNGCTVHVESTFGAVYDPKSDAWTQLPAPPGWTEVGDATSVVLSDGHFVLAQIDGKLMARLDPHTLTWTALSASGKADDNSEEGWTLLPDGTVLTVDVGNAGQSERYFPLTDTWSLAGDTAVPLIAGREIGPQVLRPDGTVFVGGATGHNAIYDSATESWSAAPDFPEGRSGLLAMADAPGVLLPDGNVLLVASAFGSDSGEEYQQLSFFFEFDGTNLNPVPAPGSTNGSYRGHLLLLPTGQVLFTDLVSASFYALASSGPNSAWAPTVSSVPATVQANQTYTIAGTQFNGLSQAVMYGDDYQAATNFPLVRITNNATGHAVYCRTHDHSTMGVATGSAPVSTRFDVPASIETGPSTIVVIANGIASAPQSLNVAPAATPPLTITAVVGSGLSVPRVAAISPNGFFTIMGSGFESGSSIQESASGALPTVFASICVEIGSKSAFLSYVSDTQINAVAPPLPTSGTVPVSVITGCGTANEITSQAVNVTVAAATPEFLYWARNSNGQNPVVAISDADGSLIGPAGAIAGLSFGPAHPGEVVTIYGIGFGPTMMGPVPGLPSTASDALSSTVILTLGTAAPTPIYAGVTPTISGLYQVNFTVPAGLSPGNYSIQLVVNGIASPAGPFLPVGP